MVAERDRARRLDTGLDATELALLEVMALDAHLEGAYAHYRALDMEICRERVADLDALRSCLQASALSLQFLHDQIHLFSDDAHLDLRPIALAAPGITCAIANGRGILADPPAPLTADSFLSRVRAVAVKGLVAPPAGDVVLGDLRRLFPLDPFFGWRRGSPVDRYYLAAFIDSVRPQIRGCCLEVGATRGANDGHRFAADSYQTVDVAPGEGDITGDVHDASLFPAAAYDSIIALHVLEHCHDAKTVVANFHRWLKPGGVVVAQVPAVQKIHSGPTDQVRWMPDGMRGLFAPFSEVAITTSGNPLAVVAGVMGLSSHELTQEELDFHHSDYPLVVNAVAKK